MKSFQAAVIQQASLGYNKADNLALTTQLVTSAVQAGAQLVVLQELHGTDYFCHTMDLQYFDLAEPLHGPTSEYLAALARQLDIVLVGSIFEKRTAGIYHNTALVFDGSQGLVGFYRKMHIPDDPGFAEKFYFTPGDQLSPPSAAFRPIQTRLGALGVLVCWDQWYPEAARLSTLQGADLLIYPTAIGWSSEDSAEEQLRQKDAWTIIQRSHAVANSIPVLVANRIGHEVDTTFWGQSFIAGHQGEILTMAEREEGHLLATIDLERTETLRRIWPYLRDRRIDAYEGLTQRCID